MGPMMYVVCRSYTNAYDDYYERDILVSVECYHKLEDAHAECIRLCREMIRRRGDKTGPEPQMKVTNGRVSFTDADESYEFYVVGLPLKNPYTLQ